MVTMHFKCKGLIRSSNMTSESSANIPNGTKGHRASSLNFKCKCVLVPCFDNIHTFYDNTFVSRLNLLSL